MVPKGYKHTPETRANISAAQKGRTITPEHRAKISAAQKGPKGHWWGKRLSVQHRANIRAALLRPDWVRSRPPRIRHKGRVCRASRLVMEKHLGRKLLPTEVVHHKNKNMLDDQLENLELMSKSEHTKLHNAQR